MLKKALFYKRANNPWGGKKLSGVRSGHMTKVIDYNQLKDKLKLMKCSYNDVFMAITSNVMAEPRSVSVALNGDVLIACNDSGIIRAVTKLHRLRGRLVPCPSTSCSSVVPAT